MNTIRGPKTWSGRDLASLMSRYPWKIPEGWISQYVQISKRISRNLGQGQLSPPHYPIAPPPPLLPQHPAAAHSAPAVARRRRVSAGACHAGARQLEAMHAQMQSETSSMLLARLGN